MKILIMILIVLFVGCKGVNTVDELKLEKGYRLTQVLVTTRDEVYVVSKYEPEKSASKYNITDVNKANSLSLKVSEE